MSDDDIRVPPNHREIKKKTFKAAFIAYAVIAVMLLVGGILIYWNLQKSDVLDFKKEPIPVQNDDIIGKDGFIVLEFDYCKNLDVDGEVVPKLVSTETEIALKSYTDSQKPGCDKIIAPIPVPPQAIPGRYYLDYEVTYQINPIKTTVEKFKSVMFDIR